MNKIGLGNLFMLIVIVYTTLHVAEEAHGNFPKFMNQNWGIPNIGYGQWLFHNMVFFVPTLLLGIFCYSLSEERYLAFGVGIAFWGIENFLEHLFYSLKNRRFEPGIYSSGIFLILAALVFVRMSKDNQMILRNLVSALICSVFYWVIPIAGFRLLSKPIYKIFHE